MLNILVFQISLSFAIIEDTAEIGVDFYVTNYTITMEEGETTTALPLYINDDQMPELEESFVVSLLRDSVTGGATLGEFFSCRVNILQSDHPYGIIGKLIISLKIFFSNCEIKFPHSKTVKSSIGEN